MQNNERPSEDSLLSYDISPDESPSQGVIQAVAAFTGTAPVPDGGADGESGPALEPLYTAVDPDALDAVFRLGDAEDARHYGEVAFVYHGLAVTVRSDGRVTVERTERRPDQAAD